jgi:hypothetical protein
MKKFAFRAKAKKLYQLLQNAKSAKSSGDQGAAKSLLSKVQKQLDHLRLA